MWWLKTLGLLCVALSLLLLVRERAPNEPFIPIIGLGTGIGGIVLLIIGFGYKKKQLK